MRVVNVDRLTPYICRDTRRLPDYVEDEEVTSAASDLVQVPTTPEGDEDTESSICRHSFNRNCVCTNIRTRRRYRVTNNERTTISQKKN